MSHLELACVALLIGLGSCATPRPVEPSVVALEARPDRYARYPQPVPIRLQGRLLDEDGSPWSGGSVDALVELGDPDRLGFRGIHEVSLFPDAMGRFDVDIEPGTRHVDPVGEVLLFSGGCPIWAFGRASRPRTIPGPPPCHAMVRDDDLVRSPVPGITTFEAVLLPSSRRPWTTVQIPAGTRFERSR